jgi:hypothetical protein
MYPIRITHRLNNDVLGRSALPEAPVVPERESRVAAIAVPVAAPVRATRNSLARGLRAVARAVEPAPRCTPGARF